MDKIYLVIIDLYEHEENSIVNICSTLEKAIELKTQYEENSSNNIGFSYHIDEINLNSESEILWDCYYNSDIQR